MGERDTRCDNRYANRMEERDQVYIMFISIKNNLFFFEQFEAQTQTHAHFFNGIALSRIIIFSKTLFEENYLKD